MFVGRESELGFLNEKYASPRAEFIVLYGRRRMGKTALLAEFCRGKRHVFYSCEMCSSEEQLDRFSACFIRQNPYRDLGRPLSPSVFGNWDDAFSCLATYDGEEKCVIVIDEFPYMAAEKKSIPSVIQNLWDRVLCEKNIMLILCGSSVGFMENEVLGARSPLHGRATGIMRLEPLPCRDALRLIPEGYTDEEKILTYATLGGNPYCLGQFESSLSFGENVKKNILRNNSGLYDEPEFMLRQELRDPATYVTLIRTMAAGHGRLSEICQAAHLDSAKASTYLRNLIELGLVKKELPALSGVSEELRSSRGRYVLTDNYFRFYYRFIYPDRTALDTGNADGVWEGVKQRLHDFASRPFEDMCIEYMYALSAAGALPVRAVTFGRWWGKVTKKNADGRYGTVSEEIDILSKALDEEAYIIGECKFRNSPFDEGQLSALREKGDWKGERYYYLFSLGGFTDGVREEAARDPRVNLVNIADVLSP